MSYRIVPFVRIFHHARSCAVQYLSSRTVVRVLACACKGLVPIYLAPPGPGRLLEDRFMYLLSCICMYTLIYLYPYTLISLYAPAGPGQLLEDHFGDGSMWRQRPPNAAGGDASGGR